MALLPALITFAYQNGYELTGGQLHRSDEEAERLARLGLGIKNSVHRLKLAIDLNLFKDGKYLSSTESHRFLGEFWESLNPLCRWGGRFGDGNHYSLEHNGVK